MKKRAKWMKMTGLIAGSITAMMLVACGAGGAGDSASAPAMERGEYVVNESTGKATGYGGVGMASYTESETTTAYDADMMPEEAVEEVMEEDAGAGDETAPVKETGRKLITTVHMSAETDDFDAFNAAIENKTASVGGYVESASVYNGRTLYDAANGNRQERYADYILRIPANKLDAFLNEVQDQSNIIDKSRSVEDVTLTYVDIESRKKALQTEYDRLLELVRDAETVEDIIALEERIATVRYEIESIESRLRTFDNQIDYSTVYLNVHEVIHFTPVAPMSAWERIRTGFAESVYDVGHGLKEFAINFVIALPRTIVFLLVVGIIVLVIRGCIRFFKKRLKKEAAQTPPPGQNNG